MSAEYATIGAALIGAVASVSAAVISNRAKNSAAAIERQMKIRQARLDERDMIQSEGGFLIPVDKDDMWRDYFHERSQNKSRKVASELIKGRFPLATNTLVQETLWQ